VRVKVDSIVGHVVISPSYHSENSNFLTNREKANRFSTFLMDKCFVNARGTRCLLLADEDYQGVRLEFVKRTSLIART